MVSDYISPVALGIVGLALAVFAVDEAVAVHRVGSWTATTAVIDSFVPLIRAGKPSEDYGRLSYHYAAAGATLVGHTVSVGTSEEDAIPQPQRFAVGKTVPAFYDPQTPADVVLDRGDGDMFTPALAGGAAVGLWLLVAWLVRAARTRSALERVAPAVANGSAGQPS